MPKPAQRRAPPVLDLPHDSCQLRIHVGCLSGEAGGRRCLCGRTQPRLAVRHAGLPLLRACSGLLVDAVARNNRAGRGCSPACYPLGQEQGCRRCRCALGCCCCCAG